MRRSGILLPVFSLPSRHGIGKMGRAAYEFVDFLKGAEVSCWQVLPLSPTGYGDSPYQSCCTYAGNPYLIDFDLLAEEGLLVPADYDGLNWGEDSSTIPYALLYTQCYEVLRIAFSNAKPDPDFDAFVEAQKYWLEDYALYMALKFAHDGKPFTEWGRSLRRRKKEAMDQARETYKEDIAFYKFIQYQFFKQWYQLKAYANEQGISIIGDIPIYVALDSADVWTHPELFLLDEENLTPLKVAGVPPDAFSETGQLWGNPLYRWDVQEKTDFAWWKERMKASARLYDVVRIDHFIGVTQYYAIPAGSEDGKTGEWLKGPGKKLTDAINMVIGDTKIIAEDLGIFVPEVKALLEETGYPGMKIIEFAFSGDRFNEHLPHMYSPNSVVYGGTHDNETLVGYFKPEARQWWELQYIADYMGVSHQNEIVDKVLKTAYASVASVVIFQTQDILKLDNWARMNTPGTVGNNWRWRMKPGELTQDHINHLSWLVDTFGRF